MSLVSVVAKPLAGWPGRLPSVSLRNAGPQRTYSLDRFVDGDPANGSHLDDGLTISRDDDRISRRDAIDEFREFGLRFGKTYGHIHKTSLL
jgi:hypothetical protein